MSTHALLIATYLLLTSAGSQAQIPEDDERWMESVLTLWQTVSSQELGLAERPIPWVVFFDSEWVWHVNSGGAELPGAPESDEQRHSRIRCGSQQLPAVGYSHDGMIELPDGGEIPPQLILFASTYGEEAAPYFVMAMPAIWRATPRHADEEGLDDLIAGVFVHEITHTQQASTLGAQVDSLVVAWQLDDEQVDDDMVQRLFGERAGFREAYESERDLLFAAADAETDEDCRELAGKALTAMQERREQWFRGDDAVYAELEEIFLSFEGSANWAAYRALIRSGIDADEALPQLRRGGKWWSQDEGLALFLVLDRLGAPWREAVFSSDPQPVLGLLADALH